MTNKLTEQARLIGGATEEAREHANVWARTVPMTYNDACAVLADARSTGAFNWHDRPEDAVMGMDDLCGAVIALARVVLAEEALDLEIAATKEADA